MTNEQQLYNALNDVAEAINNVVNKIYELFKEVVKYITNVVNKMYRHLKRYACNNYRRMHGMPMIKRKKTQTRTS